MAKDKDLGLSLPSVSLGYEAKDKTEDEVEDGEEHRVMLLPRSSYRASRVSDPYRVVRYLGMKGFRQALLTKVLCMVEPQRFIPILTYTSKAGKREYAKWVYDLDLPEPAAVSWTIGQLIVWSNDLLIDLAGEGFEHMEHVGEFLWWAWDQDPKDLGL